MRLFNFINLFKKKKPFRCGGERCIEFVGGGRSSHIYYRQPNGDEQLNFAHTTLESEQSNLKQLDTDLNVYKMQRLAREKKFIPFAKRIITRIEGYVDENGKDIKDVAYVEKYYPHHLDVVAIRGYEVDDKYKKKD